MKDVGFLYRFSVATGCLMLMLASIACTGWFFYSWLDGIPGIVGAAVGCAVQIMAYGFSGVIVHQANGPLRIVLIGLIASALSLSMLSSYATLNGYFSALQQRGAAAELASSQKEQAVKAALEQRMQLMELTSRDVAISSEAANQGLADKYRTQAKQFLQNNENTRKQLEAQITKIEELAQSELLEPNNAHEASPIEGLARLLGGESTVIMILCIWLAIMFDALPIVGITLFENKRIQQKLEKAAREEAIQRARIERRQAYQAQLEIKNEGKTIKTIPKLKQEQQAQLIIEQEKNNTDQQSNKTAAIDAENQFKILTNICSSNLAATRDFFIKLLDFESKYDSNWYVQLASKHDPELEFGVIQYDHKLVPKEYQSTPTGMYLTFVVNDVNKTFAKALELGIEILQEPRDEFYGQRRFLAREPSGCLIDVSSPYELDS